MDSESVMKFDEGQRVVPTQRRAVDVTLHGIEDLKAERDAWKVEALHHNETVTRYREALFLIESRVQLPGTKKQVLQHVLRYARTALQGGEG